MIWWPNQVRGITTSIDRFENRRNALIVASTGAGKSLMIEEIVKHAVSQGTPASVFVSRTFLLEQLRDGMRERGLDPSVLWAGAKKGEYNPDAMVQLCMTPTVASRCFKSSTVTPLPRPGLVFFDEPHMQSGHSSIKIIEAMMERGSTSLMGSTATPLGLNHIFNREDMVFAGSNPELRECGAHLLAKTFNPSEIEVERHVKRNKEGEFVVNGEVKALWVQSVAGNIVENIYKLNPDKKPMICFGPDVESCRWLSNSFMKHGIRAAHIDGTSCYYDKKEYDKKERHRFVAMLRDGSLDMIINRFVFREGVDIPELYHLIFATPVGSINSYVQSAGRVIRNHHSLNGVIIQDHGGNYWRHGSVNDDRTEDWKKYFELGEYVCSKERERQHREGEIAKEITCPFCDMSMKRLSGGRCVNCHADLRSEKPRKRVVQSDGTLHEQEIFCRPQRTKLEPDTAKKWERMFYSQRKVDKSFNEARGWFYQCHGYFPPRTLPLMPKHATDWYEKIADVTDLIPKGA